MTATPAAMPIPPGSADSWHRFYRPVEVVAWLGVLVGGALTVWLPLSSAEREFLPAMGVGLVLYLVAFFHLAPRLLERWPWLHYVPIVINVAIVGTADALLGHHDVDLALLYAGAVALAGASAGARAGVFAGVMSTAAVIYVASGREVWTPGLVITQAVNLGVFLAVGVASSRLVEAVRRQNTEAAQRNRELALLLDASRTATASLNLFSTLPELAEKIATGLPASFCRISLLDAQRGQLVTYGMYPLRMPNGWKGSLGERCNLSKMPRHQEAIRKEQPVVVRDGNGQMCDDSSGCLSQCFSGVQAACLVPIVAAHTTVGMICVGEARSWRRQPFDSDRLGLLEALARELAVIITNSQLHQTTERQVDRMAVLNEVARAISSTLDRDGLLELIYRQLNRVIRTDTYFVGLFNAKDNTMDLPVIMDEGQRFPARTVPANQGLASYVIKERKPLLVRNLTKEMERLPVKPLLVGTERMSESWLGVPMIAGNTLVGLLLLASYEPDAFSESDVALLTNIAGQAALALDNANHHAQVEEQARRDSLTGAFNHGHLLRRLDEEVRRSRKTGKPVSLIMLDIDNFKQYNDRFGHAVGDSALLLTVKAIGAHVKQTDVVGRWGGEEFGVVLPGANADDALRVAQRIRWTLAELVLTDANGARIPNPTVSQGLATCPDQTADASALVDLADDALYMAKSAGRDQVVVAPIKVPA